MKRTCSGCCALDVVMTGNCQLYHPVKVSGDWPHYRYVPTEECEKPTTVRELIRLLTQRAADGGNAAPEFSNFE
jgi:hypothetical protein